MCKFNLDHDAGGGVEHATARDEWMTKVGGTGRILCIDPAALVGRVGNKVRPCIDSLLWGICARRCSHVELLRVREDL